MHRLILAMTLLLFMPLAAVAQEDDSGPLFMQHLLGDREFFEPWGIGLDFYTMEQDYSIQSLQFVLPGVDISDPTRIKVRNELQHYDLKLDAWITPFLNVFALVGHVDADTYVDFSDVPITGLPISLGTLPVSYDGTVYGLGLNFLYGSDRWFAALNNTWIDTSLNGNFDSSVQTFTSQPRIGLILNKWTVWAGGMYLDTEETHRGTITLPVPGIPPVPFSVELGAMEHWNYAVGIGHVFSPKAHITLEIGFGERDHTLFNFTYRF